MEISYVNQKKFTSGIQTLSDFYDKQMVRFFRIKFGQLFQQTSNTRIVRTFSE